MLDKMRYINSKGESIDFGSFPYFANYNDLRDYEISYTTDSNNKKLKGFSERITEKTVPVAIVSPEGHVDEALNRLYKVIDYDRKYESKGKLFIGDYFMEGFFFASTKADYLESKFRATVILKFVSESGTWKSISSFRFVYQDEESETTDPYLDYKYDYPYDYKAGRGLITFVNEADFECNFKMYIFGQVTNPVINIAGNTYSVDCTVYNNEFLVIDSEAKSVIRYQPDGTAIDEFNNRDRVNNVFNKIPSGFCTISHNVPNGITLDIIDDRGEPIWNG